VTYGRLLALGHSPYVLTPEHLRHLHNAFARSVPGLWSNSVSGYGPLATMEQFVAAKLGGASTARIVFWLKLVNAAAFAALAIRAGRMLRGDPAQRLRAHLLWTVNPLLLWDLIAAGHVDVLAAAVGAGRCVRIVIALWCRSDGRGGGDGVGGQAGGLAQRGGPVGPLPGQVDVGAAEVAIGRGRRVDRPVQVEVTAEGGRAQVEVLGHQLLDQVAADPFGAERVDQQGDRAGHPDGVGDLNFGPLGGQFL
jgi:hypothetical protein